jgi:hypothetical protein
MEYQDDAGRFVVEDVEAIIRKSIASCLSDSIVYNPRKVRCATSPPYR